MEDMETRGQDENRCHIVKTALQCVQVSLEQSLKGYSNEETEADELA